MDMNSWFAGGAALAILAACWRQIKGLGSRLVGYLVVSVDIPHPLDDAFVAWCRVNAKRSQSNYGRKLTGDWVETSDGSLNSLLVADTVGEKAVVWWHGWIPFLYQASTYDAKTERYTDSKVTFLRGTMNIDGIMVNATKKATERKHSGDRESRRFCIRNISGRRLMANGSSELPRGMRPDHFEESVRIGSAVLLPGQPGLKCQTSEMAPLDRLAYPPAVDGSVDEAKQWLQKRSWFISRGVPWRLGWLLYGKPGSGKSSLVKAVAEILDVPVIALDLGTMTNHDLFDAFDEARKSAPCVVLIEDVDAVFDGRENVLTASAHEKGVTFDCLLNCIDGVQGREGVMLAITTNHIEKLDAAMLRAGRIDRQIELGDMDEECRMRVARRILKDWPDLIVATVQDGQGETAADFEKRCIMLAMDRWRGQKEPIKLHMAG